jgi:hypothetical protein
MKKKTTRTKLLALHIRELETAEKLLSHLYRIYKTGLEKGYDVVGVSYLIDLLILKLLPLYGGEKETVKDLRQNCENEMVAFNASPPIKSAIDELKKAGINFSVLYDTRKKEVVPSIDVTQLKLSEKDLEKWVELNLEKVRETIEKLSTART